MSIKITALIIALLLAAVAVISGCGENNSYLQRESPLDKNWGRSFETQKYSQIIDPEAGKSMESATTLDGNASQNNMSKYRQSFEEGKAQEVVNVLKLQ